MTKIHWIECPEPDAGRTYKMFLEGMRNNIQVERVDRHEDADWVFMHHMAYCLGATYDGPLEKLVVIDFRDRPNINVMPKGAWAYFVRAWHGHKRNEAGFFEKAPRTPPWPDNFFPLTMCAMDDFWLDDPPSERDIDVTCCLRNGMHNRRAVREELEAYFADKDYVTHFGPIDNGGRNVASEEYLRTLARSKIVVTCQPDRWEGDWRTWEAFASGACVISDTIFTELDASNPPYYRMIHGRGVDEGNGHSFMQLGPMIESLLSVEEWRVPMGNQARDITKLWHRAANRIDEILWRLKVIIK